MELLQSLSSASAASASVASASRGLATSSLLGEAAPIELGLEASLEATSAWLLVELHSQGIHGHGLLEDLGDPNHLVAEEELCRRRETLQLWPLVKVNPLQVLRP